MNVVTGSGSYETSQAPCGQWNASFNLIGDAPAFARALHFLRQVAKVDATVLIQGETGTGKEAAARAIHDLSARRAAPFIAVNCAAIPDALFEGELFGYARGAFTGAVQAYPGKLRLAQGGTVLLDEIGELPLPAQSKLLRALEAREVFPLGARRSEKFDVRVVAATNDDLEALVKENRFRADLFFRLNVARVHMPALRQRKEDIPALFAHYVREMSQRTGTPLGALTAPTLDALMRYTWPGNVRELRNVVEALFIDPPAGDIDIAHLPANFTHGFGQSAHVELSERERIVSVLFATKWNKCRAAEQLRWSRMTLYRKMAKYEIRTRSGEHPVGDFQGSGLEVRRTLPQ